MTVVTKTQLEDASRDADDLEQIINNPADAPDVVTRLGQTVPSIAKVVQELLTKDVGASAATILNDKVEFIKFYQTVAKNPPVGRAFVGEIFNGAQWFDGTTTTGATESSGGWKVPAGQTGRQTYQRYVFGVSDAQKAAWAGRTIRFMVELRVTSNFFTFLPNPILGVGADVTPGASRNLRVAQISSTVAVVSFDYDFVGNESSVNIFMQIPNDNAVASADVTTFASAMYVAALDPAGVNESLAAIPSIAAAIAGAQANALNAKNEIADIDAQVEMFNGATWDATNRLVTIPAGQTGRNSYAQFFFGLFRELPNAGETIAVDLVLETSTNLYSALNLGAVAGINVALDQDGPFVQGAQVPGSVQIVQTTPTEITCTMDYIIKGRRGERIAPYFQVGEAVPTTAAARTFKLKRVSYRRKSLTANGGKLDRYLEDLAMSSGDLRARTSSEGQLFNGGVFRDSGFGLTIPSSSVGNQSYVRYIFDASLIRQFTGSAIKVRVMVRTSTDLTTQSQLTGQLSVFYTDGSANYNAANNVTAKKLSSTLFMLEFTYVILGNEQSFGPYIQVADTSVARSTEGYFTYEDLRFTFATVGLRQFSSGEQMDTYRRLANQPTGSEVAYSKTIVVKPDGTGNYTTLAAAITAEGGGSGFYNRVLYKVYEGVYTDTNVVLPNFVDVIGVGQRDKIWFKGELPDNVDPATIPTVQTFWMNNTTKLKNVKVTARNMRYPIHSDSGGSALRAYQEVEDCYVEHIGNQGARDYQTSIGGDPNSVWGSEHAWGCGTHSGEKIFHRRTTWVSRTSPMYWHNNADFAEPCYVEVEGGAITCTTSTGFAISLQPLGSGQPDRMVLKGVDIRGPMNVMPTPWLAQQAYNQRGDRTSEIEVYIYGSDPVPFTSYNGADVLELRSIDAAGSAVAVSGTGATALFGTQPDYVPGGVGYPGRARSSFAITGDIAGLGLGARLGDCTTTNKTLNIVFDGSMNKTITLNQNYTSMTNAQVVTALNTALADGSRSFQALDPYADTNHLFQPEYEEVLLNTGGTAILKGMAVAFDGSQYQGRVATSSDAATLFAGIALETIVPGRRGRVMVPKGRVFQSQASFSGTPAAAFGDTFGVSSTPGVLIEGAAIPLLRCVEVRNGQGVFRLIG